jgi:hypothetical protein
MAQAEVKWLGSPGSYSSEYMADPLYVGCSTKFDPVFTRAKYMEKSREKLS